MEILLFFALVIIVWFLAKRYKKQILFKKHLHPNFPNMGKEAIGEMPIAGSHHYSSSKKIMAGDFLLMIREKNNAYDMDAINFSTLKKKKVGYVPGELNKKYSEEMDRGERFYGQVRKIKSNESYDNILVQVFRIES